MSKYLGNAAHHSRIYSARRETEVDRIPYGSFPPWAIFYPAGYEVGMASLGFHSVIAELRKLGVGVERFFTGKFPGISLDTGRRIQDFPFISASAAYEPDLLSIFSIFKDWDISCSWKERLESGGPIFGIGGALTYINPLVFSGMADWVVIGDGEPVIKHIVSVCRDYISHGDRRKLWEDLAEHESIYVPPLHQELILRGKSLHRKKSFLSDMDRSYGKSLWVTPDAAFGRTALVELQRGCRRGCRYCTIPSSFGPVRLRSLDRIIEDIESVNHLKDIKIGLVTPEAGDYPYLPGLLSYLKSTEKAVSFASLRVDNMTEDMIEAIVRSKRFGVTVAPEAGNDRMRATCGKKFGNSLIIEKLLMARSIGVKQVKLYFMMGLPEETQDDIDSIAKLCFAIREMTDLRVRASVGVFVPKPFSQWEMISMIDIDEVTARMKKLKTLFSESAVKGCSLSIQDPHEAILEHALSWSGAGTLEIPDGVSRRNLLRIMEKNRPGKNEVREQLEITGFQVASCQRGDIL